MRQRVRPLYVVIFVLALLAGVGGAAAYASIPNASGVINGCYKTANPNKGDLIVIDSAASCPAGYTALNWNQASIRGYEVVTATAVNPTPVQTSVQFQIRLSANCPAGKSPIGGGGSITWDNGDSAQYMADSAPTASGWTVTWLGNPQLGSGSGDYTARVYAVCAVT